VELIGREQALVARIWKLANSAFHITLSKARSIDHARVVTLGIQVVGATLLAISAYNFFTANEARKGGMMVYRIYKILLDHRN
jgi:HD-like signal output (HDOD) protein